MKYLVSRQCWDFESQDKEEQRLVLGWCHSPDGQLEDLSQSVVQHVGLEVKHINRHRLLNPPPMPDWFPQYLGLAVGGDLLKRSLLELLHHLPTALALLLLQARRVWSGDGGNGYS